MDVREKLVELLSEKCMETCKERGINVCSVEHCNQKKEKCTGYYADHLLANGVTVQRWIPVTERLPSEKKVIDGEEYTKNVVVRIKDIAFEKIAFYDDEVKCWFDTDFLPVAGEVTHWMPLPEPPKEE